MMETHVHTAVTARARHRPGPRSLQSAEGCMSNGKVDIQDIENRLWDSADELRANSGLKESEYSIPVLGLIFLKYADSRFGTIEAELAHAGTGRRKVTKTDYQAKGVMFLPPEARFAKLLSLPEGA